MKTAFKNSIHNLIQEGHVRIRQDIILIKYSLNSIDLNVDDLHLDKIKVLVSKLIEILRMHFKLEEDYGAWEEMGREYPHLRKEIASFLNEHDELLIEITDLYSILFSINRKDPVALKNLSNQFITFFQKIDLHDQRENEILLEPIYLDLGTSG